MAKINIGTCKICFLPIMNKTSISFLFSINKIVCPSCLEKFKKINETTKINDVNVLILYEYNNFLKSLIYQYKGCYDIELKDVFLLQHKAYIESRYKGYTIIFPPSSNEDDLKRGFSHIEQMVSCLSLKKEKMFEKKFKYKQSDQHYEDRQYIYKVFKIKKNIRITNKKYLIFDDIITSGSTIKAIINILLDNGVSINNIKVIVLCKANQV